MRVDIINLYNIHVNNASPPALHVQLDKIRRAHHVILLCIYIIHNWEHVHRYVLLVFIRMHSKHVYNAPLHVFHVHQIQTHHVLHVFKDIIIHNNKEHALQLVLKVIMPIHHQLVRFVHQIVRRVIRVVIVCRVFQAFITHKRWACVHLIVRLVFMRIRHRPVLRVLHLV